MIKVVVVENNQQDFLKIKNALQTITSTKYQIQRLASLIPKQLEKLDFNVLMIAYSPNNSQLNELVKKTLELKLSQPILFLTQTYNEEIDKNLIQLGIDDCLPKTELTTAFLNHVITHAIQRKKTKAKLTHIATHDQLTGLANRHLLYQHLEHSIGLAKRSEDKFAILFIDLDKFKLINDSLGHQIGDILLQQVSEKLKSCVRETDIIARLGNDEFAILLANSGICRNIAMIAEKIQTTIQSAFKIRGHELFITSSIGIASFPECAIEPEALLKSAEMALHKAKEIGRNQFQFFTKELNKQAKLKLKLEKNLRRALINGEFIIHLQPQLIATSGKVVGAEALLRWNHPKYGFISPTVFIPLLDDLGLLVGVESWVLNKVCQLAKKLTDQHGELRFCVNISGSHFKTGNLKENIYLALQASSLDASNLEVELTEDIMIEHVEHNSAMLSELKEIGISIALDDFGKGYSSLSYLKNFPADILKIDKAFIDHLVEDARDLAIVEAMIELSHKLGLKVVAEGIEEKEQLSHLKNIGCDYIQGYFFAKPMPIKEFESYLENKHHLSKKLENNHSQSNQ